MSAIREDASINLEAISRLTTSFTDLDIIFVASGGDNLAATLSPELSDLTLYVIDVAAGDKFPRKGGPGMPKSLNYVVISEIKHNGRNQMERNWQLPRTCKS